MPVFNWVQDHYIEILGALSGLLYLYLSIRQNILLWPVGLLTSAIYTLVFFQSRLYADMSLQVYYVIISVYGWYYWIVHRKKSEKNIVRIKRVSVKLLAVLLFISGILWFIISFILIKYTDADLPVWDGLTTALSITATWMLAKKYLEHWLFWVFIDAVSTGLYIYKELYPTVILFVVYTTMAVTGYVEWKKSYTEQ